MATHILLKNNTMPTDNRPTLAIDTSTSFLSIALEHQGEIRLFHENVGTKQSEQILPQIERLLKKQASQPPIWAASFMHKAPAHLPACVSARRLHKVWPRRLTRP